MAIIDYRVATPEDAPILTEYRIRFALEYSGEQPTEKVEVLRRQMEDYFFKASANSDCISIIATCGTEVAGIGSMHIRQVPGNFKNLSGKWGYIMNMYTVPEYRKQGIAGAIVDLLVREGNRLGITAFELHATNKGEPVYLKSGFVPHTEPTLRKFTAQVQQ